MTKQIINVGATANDRNGDSLRAAFQKVNANFTELYTALGLDVAPLNLGAFEFTNSIISTTDSTAITIDQATTVTSNLTVGGDVLPQTANGGNLGSLGKPWNSLYVSNSTIYLGGIPLSVDINGNLLVDGNLITGGGSSVTTSATAPIGPSVGDLWYDTASGRTYVYYDSSWVDASPVDGAVSTSTNELVNGSHTVSLSSVGLTAFPAISNESLFIQASELGSANASIGISAKNSVIVTADILDTAKQWTFGTEGKLTLPAGTTFEYLNAPLTGHGDGLARLDFTLVTDGVETQWAAASASPAGSGYSPGNTFTFDEVFLGIPGASVTIEVLTVGVGGSVENLGFSQPPLYPADIYRDSPINLQVGAESNRWTFKSDGTLTLPGTRGSINSEIGTDLIIANQGTGATLSWTDGAFVPNTTPVSSITVSDLGATIDVTTDGWNTSKTWTFGTDGTLTFPDNLTVVNGIIGKASTATITEGEASQTTAIESQIEITTTGIVIAKRTSVTVNDGVITVVNNNGSTLELDNTHAALKYYQEPDGPDNNQYIQFTTDSNAGGGATIETVTEDVGGIAHGRVRAAGASVFVSAKTFLGTDQTWRFNDAGNLQLPDGGNIISDGIDYIQSAELETSYNDAEVVYQDALTAWMTQETFKPVWFALPGRLAYDEMMAWIPTTGQPTLPPNLPLVAKDAQDAYAGWQTTVALSKLTLASGTAEFDFNSTGKLKLSQGGTVGGGDQAAIAAALITMAADEAAWQTLITAEGTDLNVRPWTFAGPSRAEKQAVVLSMWQAQQSGAAIDWVPISSTFYNQVRAWLAITANQDGYDEWKKLTTSVNITSEDKTWTFGTDSKLTFPGGKVSMKTSASYGSIQGSVNTPIIVYSGGSTGQASLQWTNADPENNVAATAFSGVIVGSGIDGAGDVAIITGAYNPMNGDFDKEWSFKSNGSLTLPAGGDIIDSTGTSILDRISVTGSSAVLTKDQYNTSRLTFTGGANIETAGYLSGTGGLALVNSSSQQYVIVKSDRVQINTGFPDQGTGLQSYNEWQFLKSGVFKLPTTGIIENSGKQWTFDASGRTTFPNGVVPEHSYGAAGDKEGMVVFSDPYIYYCKQDYVDDLTDIWVRVAWTGTNW